MNPCKKDANPQTLIRRAIYDMLARREHSQHEILIKLRRKGHIDTDIKPILVELAAIDVVSDERFTEIYIRYRRRKGYGPVRIGIELREKGIVAELIDAALPKEDEWLDDAQQAWQKRFGQLADTPQEKAKHYRFLQYRGFTSMQIHHCLNANR